MDKETLQEPTTSAVRNYFFISMGMLTRTTVLCSCFFLLGFLSHMCVKEYQHFPLPPGENGENPKM